ncbi:MAG: MBL fold metallo-hydrolase [Candidatus Liptonbacteria bacterium]|nr:MBL fold metallo-hydrolase [Candidatus Liptonbacteria bacterium]
MIINYFGDGCFRLQSGETSLLVDPNNNRLKADVVLKTLIAPETAGSVAANEIAFPGEYEIKDIQIQGWAVPKESTEKFLKTVYLVKWEGLGFVFLGHISEGLESEVVEEFSEQDILFVPVGDHFLSDEEAVKFAKKLEPAVIIPSFSKKPDSFLKTLGQKAEVQEKFVFKKKDLENLKNKAVVLSAQGGSASGGKSE